MIITIGGIKGGGGKTTIATNLAILLARCPGADVLLVDADEQETASDFTAWREVTLAGQIGYTAVKLSGEAVRSQVLKLATKYSHVIIDTGGRDTTSQRAALSVSDVYLVPFNPRSFDVWTIGRVEKLVSEVRAIKPGPLRAFAFLNRADVQGADNRDAIGLIQESNVLTYLPVAIVNRKAFSNAAAQGLSVVELDPENAKASAEITQLFSLVMEAAQEQE